MSSAINSCIDIDRYLDRIVEPQLAEKCRFATCNIAFDCNLYVHVHTQNRATEIERYIMQRDREMKSTANSLETFSFPRACLAQAGCPDCCCDAAQTVSALSWLAANANAGLLLHSNQRLKERGRDLLACWSGRVDMCVRTCTCSYCRRQKYYEKARVVI